jgi:hypothetical protein
VVGKDGNDYLMRDPLGEEGVDSRVSDYKSKIFAVRVLKGA